jgi:hypothetical protein
MEILASHTNWDLVNLANLGSASKLGRFMNNWALPIPKSPLKPYPIPVRYVSKSPIFTTLNPARESENRFQIDFRSQE